MTNEEAIKILEYPVKKWSMEWDEREDGLSYYEALDLAISALREQEHFREVTKKVEPLTLDELRQMDGEPVWIKLFDTDEEFLVLRNEWVDTRNPEPMILFHMRWYSHADYGKTWLAYRQKPEEGTI